jgi:hypothetical protein
MLCECSTKAETEVSCLWSVRVPGIVTLEILCCVTAQLRPKLGFLACGVYEFLELWDLKYYVVWLLNSGWNWVFLPVECTSSWVCDTWVLCDCSAQAEGEFSSLLSVRVSVLKNVLWLCVSIHYLYNPSISKPSPRTQCSRFCCEDINNYTPSLRLLI